MSAAISNKPVIQLRDLAKSYQTGEVEVKAVRGVTLDIQRGDFVAIMGASGSGKSTLMNTLGCLDQPTGGNYLLDGIAVAGLTNRRTMERALFLQGVADLQTPSVAPIIPMPTPPLPDETGLSPDVSPTPNTITII